MAVNSGSNKPSVVARRFSLWASLGDDGAASFDATGRLLGYRRGRSFFRRGLDNRLLRLRASRVK